MGSFNVRLWSIRKNAEKRRPYEVRWIVAGHEKSRSFATKLLAESFRSELMVALRAGEAFDVATGMPESKGRDESWYMHSMAYTEMKWARAAPKSRRSMAEAMTTVMMAMLTRRRNRPDDDALRAALYGWAFNPPRRAGAPEEIALALAWISEASLPVSALRQLDVVRRVLDSLALRLDGKPAAATTIYRKRAVFYNALGYAVERGFLPGNPVDLVQWKAPEIAEAIDRRVVANADQVSRLLAGVRAQGRRGDHLATFFACLYYAGMRPSEVVALREVNCDLPTDGWGRLELTGSEPRSGARWTDTGNPREARQLKRRAVATVRTVPIPPILVQLLRLHLDSYGAGPDGRVFVTEAGGPIQDTAIRRAWRGARALALTPAEAATPLARRPYDLRHAAASLWLNSGVPATEVARRLGHSVAVLMKVYANCVDGQEQQVNARIEAALRPRSDRGRLDGPVASVEADGDSAGQVRDEGGESYGSAPQTRR